MKTVCRACGSSSLFEVLDLGKMPLAGDFRPMGETNELYPLAIDGCETCGVLQVRETVPSSLLFHPRYCYGSSTVPGLVRHFEHYAVEAASANFDNKNPQLLLEVGCNDGVFLQPLKKAGYRVVGIDASENVAKMAQSRGLDVHVGFFNQESAKALRSQYGLFDVVTCSNVFAHNPQVKEFIEAVNLLLKPTGEFWVEVHSAHGLYEGLQWDCFYHEHCFYWTIHALVYFMEKTGYLLKNYQLTPMHGGALRAVFSRGGTLTPVREKKISTKQWVDFGKRCKKSKSQIQSRLADLPLRYAYGAAGRAVVLINWTGIAERLQFVVDGSPLRYGKAIPNTRVPIISEDEFFRKSDLNEWCFVTAHNYLSDIRQKVERNFKNRSFRFVTPLPDVEIE